MTKLNKLSVVNFILILFTIVFILVCAMKSDKEKIVYINTVELFNGFNMTQDLKIIEEAKIKEKTKALDSLYSKFNALNNQELQLPANKYLQQQIAVESKDLQELKDNYVYSINQKVWQRLDGYIEKYSKTNGFKVVLGAHGSGNVMYALETINITNQILMYANQQYEGK